MKQKFKDLPEDKKQGFLNLVCRLSPENLCCDGEIPKSEVNKRYRQAMREWRILEVQVGQKVSINEAEDYNFEQLQAECAIMSTNFKNRLAVRE